MKNYISTLARLISAEVGAKIIIGAISILCIAFMDQSEFAKYVFGMSVFLLLSSLISSVFNIVYIVGVTSDESYSGLLIAQLVFTFFASVFLAFFYTSFSGLFWHTCFLILVQCIFLFQQTTLQKKLKFRGYYIAEYIRCMCFGLCVVACYLYYGLTASNVFICQIMATCLAIISRKDWFSIFISKGCLGGLSTLATTLLEARLQILAIYFTLVAILLNVDILVIKTFGTEGDVANYGAAFRYYSILQVGLIVVQKLLLPKIAQTNKSTELKEIFNDHRTVSLYLLALTPLIYAFGVCIIPIVDSGRYPESVNIFLVLAVSSYLSFSFSPYSNVLIKQREYDVMVVIIAIGLLAHLTLSYLLFNKLGSVGVAVSNLTIYGAVNYAIYFRSKRWIQASL